MRRLVAAATLASAVALLPACSGTQRADTGSLARPVNPVIPAPPPAAPVAVDSSLRESARQELLGALSHDDPSVRAHAVEGLREGLGSGARDALIKALSDNDHRVRFAALAAIGELKIEAARPLLAPLVQDSSPHTRIAGVFALHRLGDKRHSAMLEHAALHDPQPGVRGNAAFLLGRTGDASAARVLRHMMTKDPSVEVRLQAAEGLWRLDLSEDALTYLVTAGLSRNPAYPQLAYIALAAAGDKRIIQHVRPGLTSEYHEVQLVAVRALGMLGSDEGYVPAVEATKSSEPRLRYLAAHALGAIGRADAQTALAPLLRDRDPEVRVAAASAILQLRGI